MASMVPRQGYFFRAEVTVLNDASLRRASFSLYRPEISNPQTYMRAHLPCPSSPLPQFSSLHDNRLSTHYV